MNSRKKVYLSRNCGKIFLKLPPESVGLFRFLLEGRDNLAVFTVLDRNIALLKLLYAPESHAAVMRELQAIGWDIPLEICEFPFCKDFETGL